MTSQRRHLLFVIHGARSETPAVRDLITRVRADGHVVDPRITWARGDAAGFARDGVAVGVDAVVAIGGDGTVNEVANGLAGSDMPLGIIPLGTANDFARQFGIPLDPAHAMDLILGRKPVRIDTAELNGRRFVNVSSGGVGAEATAETPAEAKEALGLLAYAITGVRKLADLAPTEATFTGPGFALSCEFVVFAVGNGRSTGAGTLITPRADIRDGLLDLCVVEAMPRGDFARLVLRLKRGEHVGMDGVHYVQLPAVHIRSATPMTVNLDGEPQVTRELQYRVRPLDLSIHLPGGDRSSATADPERMRPRSPGA